jgi:hypothetical protein
MQSKNNENGRSENKPVYVYACSNEYHSLEFIFFGESEKRHLSEAGKNPRGNYTIRIQKIYFLLFIIVWRRRPWCQINFHIGKENMYCFWSKLFIFIFATVFSERIFIMERCEKIKQKDDSRLDSISVLRYLMIGVWI